MPEKLHPKIDNGLPKESASFSGGTLVCACTSKPVKVKIKGQIAHNHACGCTKCWKPDGRDVLGRGGHRARRMSPSPRTATS